MPVKLALFLLFVLPLGAETKLAVRAGEAFTFKVSWAVLLGAGEIKVSATEDSTAASPRLRVITNTRTRGFARALLSFDAKAESVVDPATGRMLSHQESSEQRNKKTDHSVAFDYAARQALYSTPESTEAPRQLAMPAGDPLDLITSLIQTRTWDLKPGEKRDALVLFGDDFYELTIYAERYEEVRTSLGTFNTLVLQPRMEKTAPKGMFKKGSTVRVWISQDGQRLPVRFEVEFKIGTGVATLTNYEAPPKARPAPSFSADAKNPHP